MARVDRDRLFVDYCGDERSVNHCDTLSFGRSGDVVIDANPYLHRVLGRFRHDGRTWWIDNVGRSTLLTVLSSDDFSSASVGPGSTAPLLHAESIVAFSAGPASYELVVTNERAEMAADLATASDDGPLVTLEWGRIDLNADQLDLLRTLCEPRLARRSDQWAEIPTNKDAAASLGWTLAKFNRKLDHLCDKFARSGVCGMRGDLGLGALDRRRVLVDHAVRTGLVDGVRRDEVELSSPTGARPPHPA